MISGEHIFGEVNLNIHNFIVMWTQMTEMSVGLTVCVCLI